MFQAAEPCGASASGDWDLPVGFHLSYPSKMILTSKAQHMERFLDNQCLLLLVQLKFTQILIVNRKAVISKIKPKKFNCSS